MKRCNHYEIAFESYLRDRALPYMAVSEKKRSRMEDGSTLKNLDFVVSVPNNTSWLVDVKGRRFPSGNGCVYWKNWSTQDDLVGMRHWETLFGKNFCGVFVFSFLVCGERSPIPVSALYRFRKRYYAFLGVKLSDYLAESKLISPKWQTYAISAKKFRQLAQPFDTFITEQLYCNDCYGKCADC